MKTTNKSQLESRIATIESHVVSAINHFHPFFTLLEGHAYNSRGRAGSSLHELHGVVKQTLWKSESPFYELPPISLKAAAGNGRYTKEEVIEAAYPYWPELQKMTGKIDDLADAMWAAKVAWDRYDELVEEA